MNINDIPDPDDVPETELMIRERIWSMQRTLMRKYQSIEGLPDWPVPIDTFEGQRVIKDFAWRTVEELAESYEALVKANVSHPTARGLHQVHVLEELADALHFFVEMTLFAGLDEYTIVTDKVIIMAPKIDYAEQDYWMLTYKIGVAMNFLRNKAWKQTEVPTDRLRFHEALRTCWAYMVRIFEDAGCDQKLIYTLYFKKHQVNQFRQRSGY